MISYFDNSKIVFPLIGQNPLDTGVYITDEKITAMKYAGFLFYTDNTELLISLTGQLP